MRLRWNTYRIWRLRRLIAVMLLLPAFGLALPMAAVGVPGGGVAAVMLALWAVWAVHLAQRFPMSVDELLGIALTVALGCATLPFLLDGSAARGIAVALIAGIAGPLVALSVSAHLPALRGPKVGCTVRGHADTALPAPLVMAAMALRPAMDGPLFRTGPADAGGWFDVWPLDRGLYFPVPDSDPALQTSKVLDRGAMHCSVASRSPLFEGVMAEHFVLVPQAGRSRGKLRVVYAEVVPDLYLSEVARMWLQDFAADMLTHRLDVLAGTAGRACRGGGVDSPFLWVFTRLGFSEAELRAARTGRGNDQT